jgi:hypothetical protein
MPNWTSNIIRVDGTPKRVRVFLKAVKGDNGVFDFNRLVPMPVLIRHIAIGQRTIGGKQVSRFYVVDLDEPDAGDANFRCLTPEEEAEIRRIGCDSELEWCQEHWGTKWNACFPEITENCVTTGHLEFRFDTAWSEPGYVYRKLFARFPKLSIHCSWQYECDDLWYSVERPALVDDPSEM